MMADPQGTKANTAEQVELSAQLGGMSFNETVHEDRAPEAEDVNQAPENMADNGDGLASTLQQQYHTLVVGLAKINAKVAENETMLRELESAIRQHVENMSAMS